MVDPEAETLERLLRQARRGSDDSPELHLRLARRARRLAALGAWAIPAHDERYPPALRDLADPPAVLFGLGAEPPPCALSVAIVGARAASDYGRRTAARLAGDLARLGFVVVSGLARGIDGAAHEASLDAGGTTVAVLPSGLDHVVPEHHRDLAARIAIRGSVVSEHGAGPPPFRGAFVTRNRVIAALACATVVVEAGETSGALRTAEAARALGRPVLAVPGDVERDSSRGCHALLRRGAHVCETAADVLAAIGSGGGPRRAAFAPVRAAAAASAPAVVAAAAGAGDLRPVAARVREALAPEPRAVEAIAGRAGVAIDRVLAALLELEWSGLARRRPGGAWCAGGRDA